MPDLAPCPLCARHVQITETRCPFCDGELPTLTPRTLPSGLRRMSRTASLALGASLAVAGCRTSAVPPTSDGGPVADLRPAAGKTDLSMNPAPPDLATRPDLRPPPDQATFIDLSGPQPLYGAAAPPPDDPEE
ncbi:MAG: hypothetical protein EXR72_00700 [Myxococcales bacterium]|nr:hypothetical protein [Myxococcales bacterium]